MLKKVIRTLAVAGFAGVVILTGIFLVAGWNENCELATAVQPWAGICAILVLPELFYDSKLFFG